MSEIEYIDYAPPEVNWLRVELPHKGNKSNRFSLLAYTKVLMARLGYRINIDFKMHPNYYNDKVVFYLHPKHEQYVSWIALQWDP